MPPATLYITVALYIIYITAAIIYIYTLLCYGLLPLFVVWHNANDSFFMIFKLNLWIITVDFCNIKDKGGRGRGGAAIASCALHPWLRAWVEWIVKQIIPWRLWWLLLTLVHVRNGRKGGRWREVLKNLRREGGEYR